MVSGMLPGHTRGCVWAQVVLPLSGMGSWAVVVSGALMSLHVLGINLAPLLTVGIAPQTSLGRTCSLQGFH